MPRAEVDALPGRTIPAGRPLHAAEVTILFGRLARAALVLWHPARACRFCRQIVEICGQIVDKKRVFYEPAFY